MVTWFHLQASPHLSGTMNKHHVTEQPSYEQLQQERRALPIFSARKRLVKEVQQCDSSIVIGETGSGKTTQIPQFLYEANVNKGHIIACTQPRRVAAVTVAARVAHERACNPGELVGHCVRFDDTTSQETKIKYMTDGMLLREAILDPLLRKYGIIILDEAHERTIHTDVLFGVVKGAQKQRAERSGLPLKIVVMSATMDVDHFSNYFNDAPVLYIEGRQFPVELMYAKQPQSDYVFSSLVSVFQIHKTAPPEHDILVFLTGQEEIESVVKSIRDISKDLEGPRMMVYPLYSSMPPGLQLKAFEPTAKGTRKVIVSTNIAETSVTIHGIKFVVDSGMVKAKTFNPQSGLDLMAVQRVSKAQAWQRTGRAGRESAGTCYRLYTELEFKGFITNTIPEIQRCNLASVTLQLLAMGIKNVATFDFMDKPSPEAISDALLQLHLLGAIDKVDDPKLTETGKQMAAFPLDPRLAKVILAAKDNKCLEEVLTVVSLMCVDSVVHTPQNRREEALAVRKKFLSSEGDHITNLNIYRSFKPISGNKRHCTAWCHENFINIRHMQLALDVRKQLRELAGKQKMPLHSCGQDTSRIRRCLATGFFMNAAELQKEGHYLTVSTRKQVSIHPSSSLFHSKPAFVVYCELVKTTKCYMRNLSLIDPEWLNEIAPNFFKRRKVGSMAQ